jgi:hypothetical protein
MLETAKTPPNQPWYFPRSRADTTSPTMACASTISPPPPSPWIARKTMSWVMLWLSPHSAEPARKMTIAARKSLLRPYWSPSLPHSGVETVEARM